MAAFAFKQFTICQDQCAMKVGTDGTLLGAWANGGGRILDIGTGTGLIALMMAQRFPSARVWGIDIDPMAARQAAANVAASPFAHRVSIACCDVRDASSLYDAIVCNPPFFENSLPCPDPQRTMARHASSLSYRELVASACRLLDDGGELSLVIPADCKSRLVSEALLAGLFLYRECAVKTTPRKPARRYLLAFRKNSPDEFQHSEGIIELAPNIRSPWYQELTRDFYL